MFERIQRRATKIIPEPRYFSYEEGVTTIETRRLRGDQIEVSKILNGCFSHSRKIVEPEDMK